MFCTCYAVSALLVLCVSQSSLASFRLQFFTIFTFLLMEMCVAHLLGQHSSTSKHKQNNLSGNLYGGGRQGEGEGGGRLETACYKKHKQACSDQSCLLSYQSSVTKAGQPCRLFSDCINVYEYAPRSTLMYAYVFLCW